MKSNNQASSKVGKINAWPVPTWMHSWNRQYFIWLPLGFAHTLYQSRRHGGLW